MRPQLEWTRWRAQRVLSPVQRVRVQSSRVQSSRVQERQIQAVERTARLRRV